MKEEITINGIVYVRKTSTYKKYDEIKFKDLDWYVIDVQDNKITLLLKDVLDEERIKKYCEDDWYREGNKVRHSDCVRAPFDWNKSYIKNVILPNFKKDLNVECEITLLSKEEIEKLPVNIRSCGEWYWTRTNASDSDDKFARVWRVFYIGFMNYGNVDFELAVRPVVCLNADLLQ